MSDSFKYFVKVEKAFQDGGDWFVQGIASGTMEDRDGEKMSPEVIKKFADSMPLPLTDSHPRAGAVTGELGQVVEAQVMPDANHSLFIKAKLDQDHPAVAYMVKKIQQGKRYAFSIEATQPEVRTVWSDKLKKMVTEYISVKPKAISITTEPSYTPSFAEFVTKSYEKSLQKSIEVASNVTSEKNDDGKVETIMEEVKSETQTVEAAQDVVETVVEVKAEETAVEPVEASEAVVEVEESQAEVASEEPATTEEEKVEPIEKSVEVEAEVKKSESESAVEVVEDAEEKAMEVVEAEMIKAILTKLDVIESKLDACMEMQASTQSMYESTEKSVKAVETVQKSIHEELEVLKEMPLAKKSKVVAKSFEERVENTQPEDFKSVVANFIN